ncbi:hypothetical protein FIBSPDRAFT_847712 [Athelia psychrophila]|uniref:ABM domain-containing protein n=1 Tax=Athelia psychrophila TaxID=1759441 RepID=A0A166VVF2_9AGAM|nr:hypothetical protein FIBSPDRAFT_847712 [Fibularhizoctonia sp. CBS 109695]
MSPTTETHIALFTTSDACRADPTMLDRIFYDVSGAKGVESLYYGLQIEDPTQLYVVNNWANSDDFLAFSASEHDDVLASVVEVFKGFPKVYHINFKLDVTVPLDMPVTEIVVITSVSPEAKQKLCDTLAEVCEYLKGVMTYGTPEQAGDKDVVVVVCGWNSLEDHAKSLARPEGQELMKMWEPLGSKVVKHVKLTKQPTLVR